MSKFKIGDKVRCVGISKDEFEFRGTSDYAGSGWEFGKILTVKGIDLFPSSRNIYWFEEENDGVYETHLELVKPEDLKQPENLEKLLVDGVVLLKELRDQKKKEIENIDTYLDRIANFTDESDKEQEETDADDSGEEKKQEGGDEKPARPKRRKRRTKIEMDKDALDSKMAGEITSTESDTIREAVESGETKIWCAVCAKYHPRGTHD